MRAVIQRVKHANVVVNSKIVSAIEQGALVFLGVEAGDCLEDVQYIANKIPFLRIFDDDNGIPNKNLVDIVGSALIVSQFTLCGDARRGRRPSYMAAEKPELSKTLYEQCCDAVALHVSVQRGVFQADMEVSLINDGPFTILLDSRRRI